MSLGGASMNTTVSLVNRTVNGTEIIYNGVVEALPFIHSLKAYSDTSMQITNSNRPIYAALMGFQIIAQRCLRLPPSKTYIVECVSLGLQAYIFFVTGGTWLKASAFFWQCLQVLKKK